MVSYLVGVINKPFFGCQHFIALIVSLHLHLRITFHSFQPVLVHIWYNNWSNLFSSRCRLLAGCTHVRAMHRDALVRSHVYRATSIQSLRPVSVHSPSIAGVTHVGVLASYRQTSPASSVYQYFTFAPSMVRIMCISKSTRKSVHSSTNQSHHRHDRLMNRCHRRCRRREPAWSPAPRGHRHHRIRYRRPSACPRHPNHAFHQSIRNHATKHCWFPPATRGCWLQGSWWQRWTTMMMRTRTRHGVWTTIATHEALRTRWRPPVMPWCHWRCDVMSVCFSR